MVCEKPWAAERVLQLLIRLFASMFLGIAVASAIGGMKSLGSGQAEILSVLVSTLSFHVMALILTHYFLKQQGLTWNDGFGFGCPGTTRVLLLGLLVALGVLPIAWSLGAVSAKVMHLVHLKPEVQTPVQMLETGASLSTKVVIGALAIFLAPFAEEVVFRGLIYPTLKQHGFPKLALWGTSLLFALVHGNLMILVPLTFLAVVLTLLYESTGNLLAPIIAHSVFNGVNFFWVIIQPLIPLKLSPA